MNQVKLSVPNCPNCKNNWSEVGSIFLVATEKDDAGNQIFPVNMQEIPTCVIDGILQDVGNLIEIGWFDEAICACGRLQLPYLSTSGKTLQELTDTELDSVYGFRNLFTDAGCDELLSEFERRNRELPGS